MSGIGFGWIGHVVRVPGFCADDSLLRKQGQTGFTLRVCKAFVLVKESASDGALARLLTLGGFDENLNRNPRGASIAQRLSIDGFGALE